MKAISSEGKLPFGIGGIKVSVAKIDGKVLTETLYINRQRSGNVYDLINDNGDIYYKVSMRWYDTRGIDIPNSVEPADAINMVQDNSFMIYVDDGISMGYTMLYMGRVIKLNNGRIVKRDYVNADIPVTGVVITPKDASLKVGATKQLSAQVVPSNAKDKAVTYSSSAPTIVEVDAQTGLATALANGNADVTVTTHDGDFTDVCSIVVSTGVTGVTVSPKTATVNVGETQQLLAEVSPASATDKKVTWASSAPSVATVDKDSGLVTGVSNGDVTITATTEDGSLTDTSSIKVQTAVTGVTLTPETYTFTTIGANEPLTATVLPRTASNQEVRYESSAPTVAEVDDDGLVTSVNNGTATITVTTIDGEKTAQSIIDVTIPVTGINLTPATASLTSVGATQQLTATVLPANARNKAVTYATSAAGVATVSTSGLITAVANGTANITATTADGGFSKVCAVTVAIPVPVTTINVTPATKTLTAVNATQAMAAEVLPANATNKAVTWSSSAPAVAKVDASTGVVTALTNGTANIIATAADGSGKTGQGVITVSIPVPVASVSVSPTTATLTSVGATQQLTPTVLPANATNKAVTYSTSAAGVATVSASGLITAVANGTADITVKTTDGAKTAKCAVTVNIPVPVSSVGLTPKATDLSLSGTKTVQLVPEVLPANATNKSVTYSADEPTKVSISDDGLVTALEEGTVVITVTTVNGNKTDTATVTISA
ncbi:TPA: Ig-like domain-containing protein [Escherichia coli]|nr:Ig-like domain-containing protein [Escherichia coli]